MWTKIRSAGKYRPISGPASSHSLKIYQIVAPLWRYFCVAHMSATFVAPAISFQRCFGGAKLCEVLQFCQDIKGKDIVAYTTTDTFLILHCHVLSQKDSTTETRWHDHSYENQHHTECDSLLWRTLLNMTAGEKDCNRHQVWPHTSLSFILWVNLKS